ncbi:protein OBERON 4 isoform X1 [Lycium barbarum]|uniref:protein OBERON 4 isoform X1 n=1 Tax=Lycium barbarum TaxID=112863 RepID=UPI00293F320B|nr:protein OBERON 4 isoform X1 [Lycium barbarum]XP_060217318.1 protein OBERON 4 isoform X1 [Lycium barbarum]
MKRLRSSDDLESSGEKGVLKDWARREEDSSLHRSSSNRSFYYKAESGRKGLSSSSSSRYDRFEEDRESLRPIKKRTDYDVDNYDRRKSYNRYRHSNERGVLSSSPRGGYGADRIHRSESFSGPRRDFPKGFRSERDRSRREGSVSSWRRFGSGKDSDEGTRSGGDSARGSRNESEDIGKAKSPPGWRDAKSPAWSKDSGSEQSRSVEVKKSEGLRMESGGGHSSEMEEGELEPDHPSSATEPAAEEEASGEVNPSLMEHESERHVESKRRDDVVNSLYEQKVELSKVSVTAEQSEETQSDNVQDIFKDSDGLSDHGTSMGPSGMGNGTETVVDHVAEKNESTRKSSGSREEEKNVDAEKLPPKKREQGEEKNRVAESKVNCIEIRELNRELVQEGGRPGSISSGAHEDVPQSVKDKGKSVAVSPGNITVPPADGLMETQGIVRCGNSDMEGPSTRGLELFLSGPVKETEKADKFSNCMTKDEKFGLEPLELSLSLPNVLLPIGAQNEVQAPGSPSQGRSFQSFASSFRTNSDGYTMSMSFSGSQHFTHNPSCSLTHDPVDYEQSVKSRPLFQGVDWQALASNEQKNNDIPNSQGMLPNGTGLYQQSQASQGNSSGQAVAKHLRAAEGGSRLPAGLNRQLSTGKASRHSNGARSPTQSVGSHETGSEYNKDKKQLTRAQDSSSYRFGGSENKELQLAVGPDFIESVITTMVSEPIHVTARRFNEISGQHLLCLKEAVCDIITNPGKHWQLSALQKELQNRSDITSDTLLNSHRSQLELLVALKTGLQEFLRPSYDVSSPDLADIFLNLRCRNLTCRSLLPVDECECKVCSQKNGFCSACMCLVCSKFDMASNTCSWVGCDVCLHWCHADCGLRESYIRNGRSASGAKGSVEMQFHCVACNHPSEMFGFVKEVFQNFAKEWTAEAFSKELEYVKRIFCASEDVRGKRLHEIANYMLSKLAIKADLQEVQSQIMHFFLTEPDSVKSDSVPIIQGKELSTKNHEGNNGIAWPSQGAMWLKSVSSEKAPQVEKPTGLPSSFDSLRNEKQAMNSVFQPSIEKGPVFDELESIVRIKQAEAKMFQARADEARREADALKRIAVTKSERIEEEYITRITKLRLADAEDMRKQKLQELQSLDRAYQDYFNMKMRMENNIKDLLLKMEATRRNLSL